MPKKKMTLKEFAERYECCYSAAGVRLKKLLAKDKKFAKHVSRKGRTYLLDEYAAELLIQIFNQSVDKKSAQNPYTQAFV